MTPAIVHVLILMAIVIEVKHIHYYKQNLSQTPKP